MSLALLLGVMLDVMTLRTGAEASPYYAGLNLELLAIVLLLPWPPRWAASTAAALIGGYIAPILARGHVNDARMLVNNLFFLVSTGLIAVVSNVLREGLRWQEFANRTALVDALRHKDDFMARMSHELRTPIHVMVGYTDILLEDALDAGGDDARRLVERIRSNGVLLHGLISDLLDYAKIEAGKIELHPEPVLMRALVERVADRFRPIAARKGVALDVACVSEPPEVVTDPQRVEQILTNLVGNAVKFTERGTISIEIGVMEPDSGGFTSLSRPGETTATGPGLAILVRDTGIGIRDEDVARLASDFEQVDAAAAAKYGGTGLGLSISRRLAHRLGGGIAVRTRYAEGSTFALFLPLAA